MAVSFLSAGTRLANSSMRVAAISIIRNFELATTLVMSDLKLLFDITLNVQCGYNVSFKNRENVDCNFNLAL